MDRSPRIITDYGLAKYARVSTKHDNSAIQLLRTFGSEQVRLDACYRQSEPVFFWGGSRTGVSTEEARMLISIPTGGVASRVTLWVNGEPREAAFGSKAKVRAAYRNVAVRQRRDSIRVNWAGPDILLAQCFPIPSDGVKMKAA